MNLTLGSSCPMYRLLSSKRKRFPLTILSGSTQVAAVARTVPYFGLWALQSTSLTALGAMLPAVAALAVVAAAAAPAVPVRLSWQMTARPIAGISSARHLRLPAAGDPRPELDGLRPDQGMRMCDPYRSCVPP